MIIVPSYSFLFLFHIHASPGLQTLIDLNRLWRCCPLQEGRKVATILSKPSTGWRTLSCLSSRRQLTGQTPTMDTFYYFQPIDAHSHFVKNKFNPRFQVSRVQTSEPTFGSTQPGRSCSMASSSSPWDCQRGCQAPKQLSYQVAWKC